ncbi:MAG: hypothetical protein RIS75_60 [Actinomycetota bacterium]
MSISLFVPLQFKNLTVKNRLWVSPMCQYSAVDGLANSWHQVHYGAFAQGGTGLIMVEAAGVVPEGRITPACLGLWSDAHAEALRPIVDFAHTNNTAIGIQLAHAGRKASAGIPWSDHRVADASQGGWQTVSSSAIAYPGMPTPRELTIEEIQRLTQDFIDAAIRVRDVGFDVIELHAAHGYLFHQFLSPLSNTRTDEYGGSFENRVRFLVDTVKAVSEKIANSATLFVRISASDWTEGGWTLEESIELSQILKVLDVELMDISSGGNVHGAAITAGPGFQVPFAAAIKATGVATSAVGLITSAHQAQEIIESGKADAVMIGRNFLRNPHWAIEVAEELGHVIEWNPQYVRARHITKEGS